MPPWEIPGKAGEFDDYLLFATAAAVDYPGRKFFLLSGEERTEE